MSEQPPSASELAEALAASPAPRHAAVPRLALARPSMAVRVLLAVAIVTLLAVLVLVLVAGWLLARLGTELRADAAHRARQEREQLPEEAVLLDAAAARREARARPLAAARIWEARCRLLAEHQDWAALAATCAEVELAAPDDLTPRARLWQIEALLALGRRAEAARAFAALDQQRLDAEDRVRAAALASALWAETPPP
ncbi:MAG: hypothetical protein N3B15_06770 [Planctomycetota bacterium]|nr:hypothetical protein [Planctomycetota bacterium]